MSGTPFVDLRSLVTIAPSPPRLAVGLRAAVAIGLPLVVATALGHTSAGFLASLGGFSILYGAGAPARRRVKVIGGVGAGMWMCSLVGVLTAGSTWGSLAALVAVSSVVGFGTHALRVGPPGVYFFALGTGVANLAAVGGTDPWLILGMAAVGAVSAVVVGTSDIWLRRRGIEESAVAHAEDTVVRFEAAARSTDPDTDPDRLDRRRADASTALHAAWTAVTDGGTASDFEARLQVVHERYAATSAHLSGRVSGIDPSPWENDADRADEPVQDTDERAGADLGRTDDEQRQVERTQVRYSSLGRPAGGYLLRQAAWWPSESMLVALRVLVATAVAGSIATLIGNEHVYWAVVFAALIVQTGGTRYAQATKALQRVLGTVLGLGVFAVVLAVDPQAWWLVATIIVMQGSVELLVTRNYLLAVTLITPLAMTISVAVTGMSTETVVGDRLIDTAIGVGTAIVVLVLSGLGGKEVVLRAHARRVAIALDAVLADLVAGGHDTADGVRRRQHLYVELLESDAVARRALADAPDQVAPFQEMERVLSTIGYLVLGAGWHQHLWGRRERFELARERLAVTLGQRVTVRRPAANITEELRGVESALTGA
ncbi:FUSC family protein [Georgenia sp. Z1344]|uniref:FUSC family protein n=1 Tax=Georgenia sp. Z1344 TaxID=3416706 RepID=UPI003CF4BDB4